MIRRDQPYWQRLRKDRRSNVAAVLAALAAFTATLSVIAVAVPGPQYQARTNPAYWVLMLPMVWWVNGLARFEPRCVRGWKPAMLLAGLASGASLALAVRRDDDWTIWAVGFAVTVSAAAASLMTYRNSLVDREGPAR